MKKDKQLTFLGFILAVFLFFRVISLNIIPVFADEAIYIHWSQIAWHDHNQRFISLTDGKPPLHSWLMIPFLKVINDPLVAGRMLSVLAGLFTIVGLYLVVKTIFNKKLANICAFLAAISPFLVFYDRLAVADSLLTAFGVWAFYLSYQLITKPDLGKTFLLGFCWGGGLLTKQPALYFMLLSPLVFLLNFKLSTNDLKKSLIKIIKNQFFYWLLAIVIAFLSYNVIKLSPMSHLISVRSYDYVLGKREFLKDPFKLFWGNLKGILFWLSSYQRLSGIILFFIGVVILLKQNFEKAVVFLAWLLIPVLGSAAIGKIIFPRYFVYIQPWIIVFQALGVSTLALKTRSLFSHGSLFKTGSLAIYFLSSLPWLIFSFLIVFNPVSAPLIEREQNQYLTTWASGYGLKEVAEYLKSNFKDEKVYVATEGYFGTLPDGLMIYLDGYNNIEVYGIGQPISEIPAETLKRAKEAPTFVVVNDYRYLGDGEYLDLVKSYPKPEFPFLKQSLLFFKVKPDIF